MASFKMCVMAACLIPLVLLGAANDNGSQKKNGDVLKAYNEKIAICKVHSNHNKREALCNNGCARVFEESLKVEGFVADVLQQGSIDVVQKVLKYVEPNELVVNRARYMGSPLHYLVCRAVAMEDFKGRRLLRNIQFSIDRSGGRKVLALKDSCDLIPFDAAKQVLRERPVTCVKDYVYRIELLKLLVPGVEGSEYRARQFAFGLASDDNNLFEKARQDFESLPVEFAKNVRDQFRFVKPEIESLYPYMMKNKPIEDVLDAFVVQGDDEKNALSWFRYFVSRRYERFHEIEQGHLDAMLAKVIALPSLRVDLINELVGCGADPSAQVPLQQGAEMPVVKLAKKMHASDANQKNIGMQIYNILHVMRSRCVSRIFPHENQIEARERVRLNVRRYKKVIDCLREELGEFGKHQSMESMEDNWMLWEDLCRLLGADMRGLRKLVFPLLNKAQGEGYRQALRDFQQAYGSFPSFAFACITYSFIYYIARSSTSSDIYNIDSFCFDGVVEESCAADASLHQIRAEVYKNNLNPFARECVERFILKSANKLMPNEQGAAASSAASSSSMS